MAKGLYTQGNEKNKEGEPESAAEDAGRSDLSRDETHAEREGYRPERRCVDTGRLVDEPVMTESVGPGTQKSGLREHRLGNAEGGGEGRADFGILNAESPGYHVAQSPLLSRNIRIDKKDERDNGQESGQKERPSKETTAGRNIFIPVEMILVFDLGEIKKEQRGGDQSKDKGGGEINDNQKRRGEKKD